MSPLSLGVVATSMKENERRLPLHPRHLHELDEAVRRRLVLEHGYGRSFGVGDAELGDLVGGLAAREVLFETCDAVLLFKPVLTDFLAMREGQVLWGCPHFVQDADVTQAAIDRQLTVIAMEAMQQWEAHTDVPLSIIPQMGELAGYCSVQHALSLVGRTGNFGPSLRAGIIGFGSAGQGALAALQAQGIREVTVVTRRPPLAVTVPPGPVHRAQLAVAADGSGRVIDCDLATPVDEYLSAFDVVVNCVRQQPSAPTTFLDEAAAAAMPAGALIVDVSCDKGMGFSWAAPTSFGDPLITVAGHVHYYAVDHSPSYLWDTSSWILSRSILPYVPVVTAGEREWERDTTVARAVEVRHGHLQNPEIATYQGRSDNFPHEPLR